MRQRGSTSSPMSSSKSVLLLVGLLSLCSIALLQLVDGAAASAAHDVVASTSYSILGYSQDYLLSEARLAALFDSWAAKHHKRYPAWEERAHRLRAFRDNLEYIDAHNSQDPPSDFSLGLNRFADLTNEEYRARYVGSRLDRDARMERRGANPTQFRYKDVQAPSSIDWREKGAVSHVKDQGNCGSCWAFSAIASVEGINQIATGEMLLLSEQELVDCDVSYNQGCNGGLMDYAFEFIMKNGGINSEKDYLYTGYDGKCNSNKLNAHVVTIDGYEDVPYNDEDSLVKAVASQPISVAIEAGGRDFQLYTSGVFTGSCNTDLDHGVTAVGYGTDSGKDYWIVKNSWGSYWGECGYIRMQRNTGKRYGICGILTEPSYATKSHANSPTEPTPPLLAGDDPAPTVVCDRYLACPASTTCCCSFYVLTFCVKWGCCGLESAICCNDHRHCCPKDHPICALEINKCLNSSRAFDGVKMMERTEAKIHWDAVRDGLVRGSSEMPQSDPNPSNVTTSAD